MYVTRKRLLAGIITAVLIVQNLCCSSNKDCPLDQCCGRPVGDLIGLFQTCQQYSMLGEGCHGSLLAASCDCGPGLVCVDHSGLLALLHTSRGVCQKPAQVTEPEVVDTIVG